MGKTQVVGNEAKKTRVSEKRGDTVQRNSVHTSVKLVRCAYIGPCSRTRTRERAGVVGDARTRGRGEWVDPAAITRPPPPATTTIAIPKGWVRKAWGRADLKDEKERAVVCAGRG